MRPPCDSSCSRHSTYPWHRVGLRRASRRTAVHGREQERNEDTIGRALKITTDVGAPEGSTLRFGLNHHEATLEQLRNDREAMLGQASRSYGQAFRSRSDDPEQGQSRVHERKAASAATGLRRGASATGDAYFTTGLLDLQKDAADQASERAAPWPVTSPALARRLRPFNQRLPCPRLLRRRMRKQSPGNGRG